MDEIVNLNCWGVAIQLIPLPDGKWTWALQAEDGATASNWTTPFDSKEAAFAAVRAFCYPLMTKLAGAGEASGTNQGMLRFDMAVWNHLISNSI